MINIDLAITLIGVVILICIILNRISMKVGIPTLLFFIALGLAFTHPNIIGIPFDNYELAEKICSVCLIFIMFYGGFGTRWEEARHVYKESIILASLGVFLTALTIMAFTHFALGFRIVESFLIGAVISSTDAASVFSIIRSKKLSLRYRTSSLLEMESGSNDPFSYMLTVIGITFLTTTMTGADTFVQVVLQIGVALVSGLVISFLTLLANKTFKLPQGFDTVFIFAVALLSYSVPTLTGGNGYLSAYIVGIILGNSKIDNKIALVHFFDGTTNIMQMILFFLLGLLATPSKIVENLPIAFGIFMFLTFIGRPFVVELLLVPFKTKIKQRLVISWAGLRGAASIVFAILTYGSREYLRNDVFHIVFGIVLFSILIQGTFLPIIAEKLSMTDPLEDPLKTFNDYSEDKPIEFISLHVDENHKWKNMLIKDIGMQKDLLLVLLIKQNGEKVVPKGNKVIEQGDTLICIAKQFEEGSNIVLHETIVEEGSSIEGKLLKELEGDDKLIVLLKRGEDYIIPNGESKITSGDEIVFLKNDESFSM